VSSTRSVVVDGLVNARDLGGLLLADGAKTPSGVFFRSENADWITPAGWDQLRESGVRTVIDLRQPEERQRDVNARPDWVTTLNVDLDGLEHTEFWAEYWENGLVGTALYFLPHLSQLPHRMAEALDAIASAPDGGVLFHCMSGRDRTGMVSLVLLAAVGALRDEIVDDYLETVRLGDLRARTANLKNTEPELELLCNSLGTTTERAFRDVVASFDFHAWATEARLSDGTRRAITTWRGTL
jgi:protein tyrosine/serine phosphatase